MVYILYGTIEYLIEKQVNKIIEENNIENINISKYNMLDDSLIKIINDANSLSLFDLNKCIVVNNSYIFTGTNPKKTIEQNTTILENYLNNINPNVILIFIVNNDKLDERKKITKLGHKFGNIIEFNNINLNQTVLSFFENYKINNECINLLIDRVGENVEQLYNEIEKIKLYKLNDYNITKEDILDLTTKTLEDNNFKLIDAIVSKNKDLAIKLYEDRIKLNEEPIAIIITLANQIRIMFQVKGLYSQGHTENDIASILNIHPYRVKLAIQNCKNYDTNSLLNLLNKLADIDYNIKSGKENKNLALELFILNM